MHYLEILSSTNIGNPEWQKVFDRALEMMRSQKTDEAVKVLEDALLSFDHPYFHCLIGASKPDLWNFGFDEEEKIKKNKEHYKIAVEQGIHCFIPYLELGALSVVDDEPCEKSIELLEKSKAYMETLDYYYWRGCCAYFNKQDEAIEYFNKFDEKLKDLIKISNNIIKEDVIQKKAFTYKNKGQYKMAMEEFEKLILFDHEDLDFVTEARKMSFLLNDNIETFSFYERVKKILLDENKFEEITFHILDTSKFYMENSQYDTAAKILSHWDHDYHKMYMGIHEEIAYFQTKATLMKLLGNFIDAVENHKKAIDVYSLGAKESYFAIADIGMETGDKELACEILDKAFMEYYGKNEVALKFYESGFLDEALKAYNAIIEEDGAWVKEAKHYRNLIVESKKKGEES